MPLRRSGRPSRLLFVFRRAVASLTKPPPAKSRTHAGTRPRLPGYFQQIRPFALHFPPLISFFHASNVNSRAMPLLIFTIMAEKMCRSLASSCLTSSTARCRPTTAGRPCRSTATSARSSSTNATSGWPAASPPCCRGTPTRPSSSPLAQVGGDPQGGFASCPLTARQTFFIWILSQELFQLLFLP